MSKITIDGLAGICGTDRPVATLYHAIDEFNLASQMVDDIEDWREDLRDGTITLLLAKTAQVFPAGEPLPRDERRVLGMMIECGAPQSS